MLFGWGSNLSEIVLKIGFKATGVANIEVFKVSSLNRLKSSHPVLQVHHKKLNWALFCKELCEKEPSFLFFILIFIFFTIFILFLHHFDFAIVGIR